MTSSKKKYEKPEVRMIKAEEDLCWEGNWGGSAGYKDNYGNYHRDDGWHRPDGNIIDKYDPTNWGENNQPGPPPGPGPIWEE